MWHHLSHTQDRGPEGTQYHILEPHKVHHVDARETYPRMPWSAVGTYFHKFSHRFRRLGWMFEYIHQRCIRCHGKQHMLHCQLSWLKDPCSVQLLVHSRWGRFSHRNRRHNWFPSGTELNSPSHKRHHFSFEDLGFCRWQLWACSHCRKPVHHYHILAWNQDYSYPGSFVLAWVYSRLGLKQQEQQQERV